MLISVYFCSPLLTYLKGPGISGVKLMKMCRDLIVYADLQLTLMFICTEQGIFSIQNEAEYIH